MHHSVQKKIRMIINGHETNKKKNEKKKTHHTLVLNSINFRNS
jgi:hypothetical protein